MFRRSNVHLLPLLIVLGGSGGVASADEEIDFFESKIRPILSRRCEQCHGERKQQGGLRLDGRPGWLRGGERGSAVVPGEPEESRLVAAVRYDDEDLQMPPDEKLPDREIADLVEWVRRGAPDPRDGGSPRLGGMTLDEAKRWWSFRPVKRPEVPSAGANLSNPIDRFLRAGFDARGIAASPPADKRILIRRATYDLHGLPPTPEDVDRFLADDSADAFDRVVDRLLDSPQYGERWGRHWLDLVRYADTAGENSDRPLPQAWRYRNWVFDALNRDLPYDEFLRDQIAGDILAPGGPPEQAAGRVIATGFLTLARRFGHDIDKDVHLTYEDIIDTTGQALLGLTIGCARCHSHKYDPISAEDYYALYGILASTKLAFPGCEPKPLPRDLVPIGSMGELAYAAAEGSPTNARLQLRGDPEKPGVEVPRRWLEVFGGESVPDGVGSGRRQLADWLTDPANPLTARVMVNRVWLHHFGQGLVKTPNDFGTRGLPPTHPELLDWLAAEFVEQGWRIKPMHRLIMMSDAYQRSSNATPSGREHDPGNDLHWRFVFD